MTLANLKSSPPSPNMTLSAPNDLSATAFPRHLLSIDGLSAENAQDLITLAEDYAARNRQAEGANTIIPAHYHGSTVGVTLALMGLVYLLLPHLGYADVKEWRSARWQSVLYGSGQLLHVIGFALAGSEGASRKAAGAMENATELATAGMQLVRLGGLLAVIGGGLFVVVVIRAMRRRTISLEPA